MKAIVTVVGKDRVGIIANVCVALAGFNVNVLDISQTVMQGYFTMMMAVDVSLCNVPLAELVTRMEEIGKDMGNLLMLPLGIVQATLGIPLGLLGNGLENIVIGLCAPFQLVGDVLILPLSFFGVGGG